MKNKNVKRMSKEERREQILESALNIFIEKGYNGSTTMDIAKESGISEVTLFRYFDSKKQMFLDAIEPILVSSLRESLESSKNLGAMEKLKYILIDRIKFISNHNEVIKLILMESKINPEIADFNFINQIASLLQDAMKKAGIDLKKDSISLRLLMGSILSFLYLPEMNDEEINNYVEKFINIIIRL